MGARYRAPPLLGAGALVAVFGCSAAEGAQQPDGARCGAATHARLQTASAAMAELELAASELGAAALSACRAIALELGGAVPPGPFSEEVEELAAVCGAAREAVAAAMEQGVAITAHASSCEPSRTDPAC